MVKNCLQMRREFTAYLDADAVLINKIDEVPGDYDIGVTIRRPGEQCTNPDYMPFFGRINAGVIFFNCTPASIKFCNNWESKTQELQNDQRALNVLIGKKKDLVPGEVFEVDGLKVKCFPAGYITSIIFQKSRCLILKYYITKIGLWKKIAPKEIKNTPISGGFSLPTERPGWKSLDSAGSGPKETPHENIGSPDDQRWKPPELPLRLA